MRVGVDAKGRRFALDAVELEVYRMKVPRLEAVGTDPIGQSARGEGYPRAAAG